MTGAMRIYKSFDEIKTDPRYKPDNRIDLTNYKELTGYYAFPEGEEIKCCVRKPNGNPCDTAHRKGWVPLLVDGSITVIGGNCAHDKFGAESIVGRDITAAKKAIRKQEGLERWQHLLGDRELKLAALASARARTDQANQKLGMFQQALGSRGWWFLSEMSRTGSAAVQVWGIVATKRNEDGDVIREGSRKLITLGRIAPINVCQDHIVRNLVDDLKRVTEAYQVPEEVVAQMGNKDLEVLLGTLEEHSRSVEAVTQFEDAVQRFLANDFTLLAFLTDDKSERVYIARFGLEHAGKPAGRHPAKTYLQTWEARLKADNRVERITPAR